MPEAPVSPADAAARIAALEASLARANAALAARDLLIDTLRGQIARLRRMQFGASSEKLGREIEQLELALEELETERDAPGAEAADPGVAARPVPVRSLPGHLPREEVVHEPASGACTCPDCGGPLRPLGADAHEMLDIVPVRWRVVHSVRPKYSCRTCEKIVQAPAPVSAIVRGKATFATLAHIVVSKFDHHLPLYRQAEMMAAQGLDIDRSTLAGWTGQAAALLDPIVSRIRDEVLKTDKIHADDTPVPVLDPGRGKTATGRLWVYAVDDQASGSTAPRATWYRFTPDRTAAHPTSHLAGFRGFLQADAYAGYDGLYRGGTTEVACWAHFRRKVFDLHEQLPTPLTTDILERIGSLYAVEAEARGQPPDVRCRARQEKSRPLVDALREVLDAGLRRLSPRSDMAKAIAYGTKRWPALSRFLDDGRLEIDNNIAERALRGVAVGRRNWLFAGSRAGGEPPLLAGQHAGGHDDAEPVVKLARPCLTHLLRGEAQRTSQPRLGLEREVGGEAVDDQLGGVVDQHVSETMMHGVIGRELLRSTGHLLDDRDHVPHQRHHHPRDTLPSTTKYSTAGVSTRRRIRSTIFI